MIQYDGTFFLLGRPGAMARRGCLLDISLRGQWVQDSGSKLLGFVV